MGIAVSGGQLRYCFFLGLIQDTVQNLLGVSNLGGLEMEDYRGIVPVQSKHLAHQVSD